MIGGRRSEYPFPRSVISTLNSQLLPVLIFTLLLLLRVPASYFLHIMRLFLHFGFGYGFLTIMDKERYLE